MKSLPAGLQDHLDSGTTSMVYCWKVTRKDGTIQGFTEHDEDITFGSLTYSSSTGFTASRVSSKLGLAVENLTLQGLLDAESLNETDLACGRYDDADVELWWVNFEDLTQRILVSAGSIGEVKRTESSFEAEFRSQSHRLQQRTGRTYQRFCDAALGDTRCKKNLNTSTFRGLGTIISADGRNFSASGPETFDDGWFLHGKVTMLSGDCEGLSFEVKGHTGGNISLWQLPPKPLLNGDTFHIFAGCKQDNITCRTKFDNLINFQGFPFMPGNDVVQRYPVEGEEGMDGGSLGLGRDNEA